MRKYLDANIIANTKDMPKDEWLKKRKCGIGGSDASSILGFNPYKSSMAVYLDKIDDEIRFAHVANGSKGEPVAQNCYANLLGDSKGKTVAQNINANKESGSKEKVDVQNCHIQSEEAQEDEIRYAHVLGGLKDKPVAQDSDAHRDSGLKDKPVDQNSDDKFDKDLKEDYFIQDDKNSYKMELSNKLKSFVANEFTLKTGKKVRNINGILRNDKYPFAIANIDRAVVGEKAFLECKVTNSFNKKEWIKTIPIHYKIQMNHYMAVTGASHCYVAVLIGNEELVIHKIERDEDYIEEIMKLEEIFWNNCILGNELPMPDGSSDYSKTLDTLYKDSKCEELILFEAEKIHERYDEVVKIYKDFEKEKKAIEQYLKLQMKNYEIAYVGDRKITWKKQERNSIDTTRLKKEHPEIVAGYMKTTTSRVLKII